MIRFPIDFLLDTSKKEAVPFEKPSVRRFWPIPPLIDSVIEYQDINNDVKLRKDVTKFFHEKVIKWVNEYAEFKKYKSKLKFLNSIDGQMHIYNLL